MSVEILESTFVKGAPLVKLQPTPSLKVFSKKAPGYCDLFTVKGQLEA